jgi:hypothetical protein
MKAPTGNLAGLTCKGIVGPFPCDVCKKVAAFADIKRTENIIFCKACTFRRVIDKRHARIVENDGSVWQFDNQGNKRRVRA